MRSTGKYIWLLIAIAFVGGFLVVETSGLLGRAPVTPSTAVAVVNGQEITYVTWQRAVQEMEQQQTQATGRSVTLDERRGIEDRAFNQLVDEALLNQELKRRGIQVTDEELREAAKFNPPPQLMQNPELQTNGQFDYDKYLRLLSSPVAKQSGLLYNMEMQYRDQIPKQKLYEQIASGVYPSDGILWRTYRDAHDSAQVSYAVFRPGETPDPEITVSDADIRTYYDTHKDELKRPGHAVITFTSIPRLITAADSAAVLQHANDLRTSIVSGREKFEDVARSESEDSSSAVNGGDLGKGAKGRFVPAFEAAANQLAPGELSQPVLTQFGYHIIRLDSRNGDTLSLHHILLRIHQSDSAASRIDRKADSLSKLAGGAETPDKFDAALKSLGLTGQRANVVEGEPLTVNGQLIPSVSAWAFTGVHAGESSDLFDSDDGYFIARLESVTPGGVPSLDAVKNDIRAELVRTKTLDKLIPVAQKFATAAVSASLEQAGRLLNTPVTQTPRFARLSDVPGLGQATQAIGAAFSLPVGAISAPVRTDEAVYVMRVDWRLDADRAAFEHDKAQLREQQIRVMQQDRIREYMAGLRKAANIKDKRQEIQMAERRTSE